MASVGRETGGRTKGGRSVGKLWSHPRLKASRGGDG